MRIACIDGDGIGPELMGSAREVLAAAASMDGLAVEFGSEPGGAQTYLETGEPLAAGALERFRSEYDAVLKGPVGLPEVRKPDGTEAGVLGGVLRNGLDTYANVRPVRLLPGVRDAAAPIDYVIVRENTEGLYLSRGSGVRNERAASDQLLMTRVGVERIVRFAFDTARARTGAPKDGVRRVTCVDKSNVLRSFAFFRDVFDEIAAEYPDVEADHRYTDAAAHDLVADPGHFDVLVTENFVGDMLSDLGAATVGGLGTCPSGNIGERTAYFEPVHGSAPSIAGQDKANPTSQLLTAAMLLDHVGAADTARRITGAVEAAYADGAVGLDPDGTPTCGTKGVTTAVLNRLRP
ncbi:isocitrate/isopropylmalate dehydrogenase family protein [Saccharopolyspora mangrovi]|uniref:Isocitrate/isopropylmalate family dehydrogenase n=1 Tax=Saccharopolyspora mangrovi TaxID=3082379 RepID=A0ABU6A8S3_9PSEU|nr:isocitrate/isopropylmalate family dehydrogenase [Saccharopolyspora sp. S2-29]MEB3367848.1 isocitrate/isopropylmalate family dehydrogenase [Saccharopolyspora sp. S2-29]